MDRSGQIPTGGKALAAVSRTKQPVSGEDFHILAEIGCICFLTAVEKAPSLAERAIYAEDS